MMSDIGLRAFEDLEETHRNLEKSVEMIEEKQRLLKLVSELREGIHNADGQISQLAELVSSERTWKRQNPLAQEPSRV